PSFKAALENDKPERIDNDDEWVRKIYQELVQTDIYQAYITTPHTKKEDTDIVKFIFTDLLLPNEDFVSHVEEFFLNWEDDAEMVNQLALNYFQKGKPMDFTNIVGEEKRLYAHQLLEVVQSKGDYLLELIKPKLNNWDADRIASIDLLLLQMGLAEFLYFETIPTKVTINEYIDLAKEYSTVQSGQFINGLLDNLHKELLKENKIHKVDFKLKA
ncbi:MAG: transcription antitermination factor NusB, partial [Bacteroidetes bacterium]